LRLVQAAVAAVALLATAADTGHAKEPRLERHRPLLAYDSGERYFARSVDSPARSVVYGHLVRDGLTTWLQYWIYYAYNPQDRGIVRTGRHKGDWELVQLRLSEAGTPDLATLAQHSWAAGCDWTELRHENGGPIVFVANGSHAAYPRPGTADRPFPDPNDEADGRGRRLRPPVVEIADGRPDWVERREPWGDSRAGWVPGEQSSPRGPKFQEGNAWTDPAGFHADRARGCFDDPPRRAWQTALTFAGALVIAFAAVALLRRRFIQSPR
jgi:hypothetical protein